MCGNNERVNSGCCPSLGDVKRSATVLAVIAAIMASCLLFKGANPVVRPWIGNAMTITTTINHRTRLRMSTDDDGPVKAAMGSICTEPVSDDGPVDLLDGVHMHGASAQWEVVKVPLSMSTIAAPVDCT